MTRRLDARKLIAGRRRLLGGIAVLAICIPLSSSVESFSPYNARLLYLVAFNASAALSLYLVLGMTGQFALATNGLIGVGAYISGILLVRLDVPYLLAAVAATIGAALFGLLLGLVAMRVKGHYLALVTVAFSVIVVQILTNWTALTGGGDALIGIPRPSWSIGFDLTTRSGLTSLMIIFLAAVIFTTSYIERSQLGVAATILRADEDLAESLGVNTYRVKVAMFTVSGLSLGLLGTIEGAYSGVLEPNSFSLLGTVGFLTMIVIGGFTIGGTIVGAVIVTLLPEVLRVFGQGSQVVLGVIMLLVILLAPSGVLGSARKGVLGIRRRSSVTKLSRREQSPQVSA